MEKLENNFSTNDEPTPTIATVPQTQDDSNEILYFSINQEYK